MTQDRSSSLGWTFSQRQGWIYCSGFSRTSWRPQWWQPVGNVILWPWEVVGDGRNHTFQGGYKGGEMRSCNQLRNTTVGLLLLNPILIYTHSFQDRNLLYGGIQFARRSTSGAFGLENRRMPRPLTAKRSVAWSIPNADNHTYLSETLQTSQFSSIADHCKMKKVRK